MAGFRLLYFATFDLIRAVIFAALAPRTLVVAAAGQLELTDAAAGLGGQRNCSRPSLASQAAASRQHARSILPVAAGARLPPTVTKPTKAEPQLATLFAPVEC